MVSQYGMQDLFPKIHIGLQDVRYEFAEKNRRSIGSMLAFFTLTENAPSHGHRHSSV